MSGADSDREEEIVDGELVWPEPRPGQALDRARAPVVQSAVAAATGFVAGAATLALMHRYGRARLERAPGSPGEGLLPRGAAPGSVSTYIVHVRPLRTLGPGAPGE